MGIKDYLIQVATNMSYPLEQGERKSLCKWLFIDKYGVDPLALTLNEPVAINTAALEEDIKLLNEGFPLQYLVGFTFFDGLKVKVNESVLIPRPETEELIHSLAYRNISPSHILDIGTGSGCIALALKNRYPKALVTAYDISENALATARENAAENKLEINFQQKNALNLAPEPSTYDLIVSNPPYITRSEKKAMSRHVKDHEPHLALFVEDTSALIFYEKITSFAQQSLKNEGILAFETSSLFGSKVVELLKSNGFSDVKLYKDMSNLPRFVIALQKK